jgi:hypothetical protein
MIKARRLIGKFITLLLNNLTGYLSIEESELEILYKRMGGTFRKWKYTIQNIILSNIKK